MQKQRRFKAYYIKPCIHMYTKPTMVYTYMLYNL